MYNPFHLTWMQPCYREPMHEITTGADASVEVPNIKLLIAFIHTHYNYHDEH